MDFKLKLNIKLLVGYAILVSLITTSCSNMVNDEVSDS